MILGYFEWDGKNFSRTAQNVRLNLDHGDGPVIEADLRFRDGTIHTGNIISLAERIENQNGELVYGKSLCFLR